MSGKPTRPPTIATRRNCRAARARQHLGRGASRLDTNNPWLPARRRWRCLGGLDLGADGDPDEWSQQFLTEIAGDLPGATMVQSPSADGQGIELHILAARQ